MFNDVLANNIVIEFTKQETDDLLQHDYVVIERDGYTSIVMKGEIPLNFIAALINYALRKSE